MAPKCTIFGGTNGSGKSALFEIIQPDGEFVNADSIARRLNPVAPDRAAMQAGRAVLRRLQFLIGARRDFIYETTLASHQALSVMVRARGAGYQIGLVYVALDDVELHIKRVAVRVAKGGHDIPENVIRRRYEKSWQGLAAAIPLADGCLVFDNSGRMPILLLEVEGREIAKDYLDRSLPLHLHIAGVIAQGLRNERG